MFKTPLIIGQAELMFWQFPYVLGGGGGGGERLYLLCKLRLRRKKSLLKVSNRYIYTCSKSKSLTDIYLLLVHSAFYNSRSPLLSKWSKFA